MYNKRAYYCFAAKPRLLFLSFSRSLWGTLSLSPPSTCVVSRSFPLPPATSQGKGLKIMVQAQGYLCMHHYFVCASSQCVILFLATLFIPICSRRPCTPFRSIYY